MSKLYLKNLDIKFPIKELKVFLSMCVVFKLINQTIPIGNGCFYYILDMCHYLADI